MLDRENALQFILPLCVVMSEHQGRCRFFDLLLECSEGYVVMKSTVELCLPLNTLFVQTLLDFQLVYDLNKPYTGSSHVLFLFCASMHIISVQELFVLNIMRMH